MKSTLALRVAGRVGDRGRSLSLRLAGGHRVCGDPGRGRGVDPRLLPDEHGRPERAASRRRIRRRTAGATSLPIQWNVTGAPGASRSVGEDGADGDEPDGGPGRSRHRRVRQRRCRRSPTLRAPRHASAAACNGQDGADGDSFCRDVREPERPVLDQRHGHRCHDREPGFLDRGRRRRNQAVETLSSDGIVVRSGGSFDVEERPPVSTSGHGTHRAPGEPATMTIRGSVVNINCRRASPAPTIAA